MQNESTDLCKAAEAWESGHAALVHVANKYLKDRGFSDVVERSEFNPKQSVMKSLRKANLDLRKFLRRLELTLEDRGIEAITIDGVITPPKVKESLKELHTNAEVASVWRFGPFDLSNEDPTAELERWLKFLYEKTPAGTWAVNWEEPSAFIDPMFEHGDLWRTWFKHLGRRLGVTGKPSWDECRGEIFLDGQVVKRFRSVSAASNCVAVLNAFQKAGWPQRVDDPFGSRHPWHVRAESTQASGRGSFRFRSAFRENPTNYPGVVWLPPNRMERWHMVVHALALPT